MKTVSQGIFMSMLIYCLPLYGGCDKNELNSLQVLQNRAAKIVTRSPPRTTRDIMYNRLDWLTVNQLVVHHTIINIYKIRTVKKPDYLSSLLCSVNINGNIILPRLNLQLAEKSFVVRGAKLWNSLPSSLKDVNNTRLFKTRLRQWVVENVPKFID